MYIKKKYNPVEATLKNLIQKKKARHKPSGWSMFIISLFDEKKKKKIDYYRGQDCIEELCNKLKESAMEIIYYEKKRYNTIKPRRK